MPKIAIDQMTLKGSIGEELFSITAAELMAMGYLAKVEIEPVEIEDDVEEQFPDYIRCDFRTGFKYNSKRITQEIGIDLNNVTNHQNIFSQHYNKATQQISTVYQQGFMLILFYRINL